MKTRTSRRIRTERRLTRNSGFLLTELVVSIGLTGLILLAFSLVAIQFSESGKRLRTQHQAVFAAESELDRIRAGAPPSSPNDLAARFPGLTFAVDRAPADGQWKGFDRVTVTVRKQIRRQNVVACRLSAFVPAAPQQPASEGRP